MRISSSDPQIAFQQQYAMVRRDEVAGVLLALFLGGIGMHHFYLRRTGLGILYLCLCWTPLPWFLGFVESFFMPGRVRRWNAFEAESIVYRLGLQQTGWQSAMASSTLPESLPPVVGETVRCPRCAASSAAPARYCSACGVRFF